MNESEPSNAQVETDTSPADQKIIDEHDRATPLPGVWPSSHWHWSPDEDSGRGAIAINDQDWTDGEPASVWVCDGDIDSNRSGIEVDVAIAVALASKGFESYEVMASGLERMAAEDAELACRLRAAADKILSSDGGSVHGAARAIADAHKCDGRADALREVAAMLRVGRVTP
jgi:hypothetical protein